MIVRVPNAMTKNHLGLSGLPFPVSLQIERHLDGVVGASLYPIEFRDVADLLVPSMLPLTVLTGVDTDDFTAKGLAPLRETLAKCGVEVLAEGSDAVLVATPQLSLLFGDLWTSNLTLVDLPSSDVDLAEVWCALPADWPALSGMATSRTYLSTHDNVYLHAEFRDDRLAIGLCQRLLSILVGTHLLNRPGEQSIVEPSARFVERALGDAQVLSCDQRNIGLTGSAVSVPFVHIPQRPFDRCPAPTHRISYDTTSGAWSLAEVS